ncbi:hypothetical protein ACWD0A_34160 [Streptomyces sp. NPDC002867]
MVQVTPDDESDMQVFLRYLGVHLREQRADVLIDLYVDEEEQLIGDAEEAYTILRARAERVKGRTGFMQRILRQKDPYMGVPLALSEDEDVQFFALLAHLVIGCEAWVGDKQVFSASGPGCPVWVKLETGTGIGIIEAARATGAGSVKVIESEH